MPLAVDIGNTTIATCLVRDGRLGPVRRVPTAAGADRGAVAAALDGLIAAHGANPAAMDGLVVASVVPSLTAHLRAIAGERRWPLLVADHTTVPIPVRVDLPETVGADRLVDAYAAARLHGVPAVVLDFGTATTVDAVGSDGAYLGGAIAPGLEIGLDALAARTALLPMVGLRAPSRAIATTTEDAILAGTILGYADLAAGLLRRVRRELAESSGIPAAGIRAIATGGLTAAPWFGPIEGVDVVDPLLTLAGLAALWAEVPVS